MAIFNSGPAIGALSGSIGGDTFSHNRGGPYIRRRAIPVNPKTSPQVNIRAILAGASANWREIPATNKLAWNTWAAAHPITNALGNAIYLSGHQAFIQLNTRLEHDGDDTILDPPVIAPPTPLLTLSLTCSLGHPDFEATFTPTPCGANERVIVYACVLDSEGISNVNNRYRWLGHTELAVESPIGLHAWLVAHYGPISIGQVVHIRCHSFDTTTGLWTAPLTARADITA